MFKVDREEAASRKGERACREAPAELSQKSTPLLLPPEREDQRDAKGRRGGQRESEKAHRPNESSLAEPPCRGGLVQLSQPSAKELQQQRERGKPISARLRRREEPQAGRELRELKGTGR